MTIFGGFWAPFGRPLELIFGTLGVILEVQKKSRKKDAKNEQTQRPPGPARRNARVPGEDLGGVKTQQKGEEQQGAEQRRGGDHRTLPSDLTRSLPPSPGGGRIPSAARIPPGRLRNRRWLSGSVL